MCLRGGWRRSTVERPVRRTCTVGGPLCLGDMHCRWASLPWRTEGHAEPSARRQAREEPALRCLYKSAALLRELRAQHGGVLQHRRARSLSVGFVVFLHPFTPLLCRARCRVLPPCFQIVLQGITYIVRSGRCVLSVLLTVPAPPLPHGSPTAPTAHLTSKRKGVCVRE
jgi:hypothetical protein